MIISAVNNAEKKDLINVGKFQLIDRHLHRHLHRHSGIINMYLFLNKEQLDVCHWEGRAFWPLKIQDLIQACHMAIA